MTITVSLLLGEKDDIHKIGEGLMSPLTDKVGKRIGASKSAPIIQARSIHSKAWMEAE